MRTLDVMPRLVFALCSALGVTLSWLPLAQGKSSNDWIAEGLALEKSGDISSAETALLTAVEQDRRFLPAWTLANFYFRRGRDRDFMEWSRRASVMQYDDARPLLRLLQSESTQRGVKQ